MVGRIVSILRLALPSFDRLRMAGHRLRMAGLARRRIPLPSPRQRRDVQFGGDGVEPGDDFMVQRDAVAAADLLLFPLGQARVVHAVVARRGRSLAQVAEESVHVLHGRQLGGYGQRI